MSAAFLAPYIRQNRWHDPAFLSRSEHTCDSLYRLDLSLLELSVTSCHIDQCVGILPVQLPDDVAALLVGMFRNRACVHKEDVRSLAPWHSL